jgi:hypothetical protein
MLCKRTSLAKVNLQTNRSFAGTPLQGALGSMPLKAIKSLYLKVYPVEFMVAVINNQGGFYRTESLCAWGKCPVLSTLLSTKVNRNYIWSWRLPRFYATRGLILKQHIVSLQIVHEWKPIGRFHQSFRSGIERGSNLNLSNIDECCWCDIGV